MTPAQIIESYVVDVARHLPGRMRADVAAELRELLTESLHERFAGAPGTEQALEVVREFGQPAEVAARYAPPFALIDPTDTRLFITLAIIGSAVVGVARQLVLALDASKFDTAGTAEYLVGLFLFFAIRGWIYRADPQKRPAWRPAPVTTAAPSRVEIAFSVLFSAVFVTIYLAPGAVLDFVTGGSIGGSDVIYTDSFRHWTRISWIPLLLFINVAIQATVALRGRWTTRLRLADIFTQIILVLQVGWHLAYGEIFADPAIERVASVVAATVALIWAIEVGVKIYRFMGAIPSPEVTARLQDAHEKGLNAVRSLHKPAD